MKTIMKTRIIFWECSILFKCMLYFINQVVLIYDRHD